MRIEDTDKARSTDDAIAAIHDALDWLGLAGDNLLSANRRKAAAMPKSHEHLSPLAQRTNVF